MAEWDPYAPAALADPPASWVERRERRPEEPDACRLDREPNDHLTFGRGIHKCIGMDLARLELKVVFEELLACTSLIELAEPPTRTTFIRRGVSCLPVRLHVRA